MIPIYFFKIPGAAVGCESWNSNGSTTSFTIFLKAIILVPKYILVLNCIFSFRYCNATSNATGGSWVLWCVCAGADAARALERRWHLLYLRAIEWQCHLEACLARIDNQVTYTYIYFIKVSHCWARASPSFRHLPLSWICSCHPNWYASRKSRHLLFCPR